MIIIIGVIGHISFDLLNSPFVCYTFMLFYLNHDGCFDILKVTNNISITFAFVRDGVVYREKAVIEAPMREHQLDMKWETFRDRLTPGQQEEWTMKIRQTDGTPAKAQLLAVLYDASLDQIAMPQWSKKSQMLGFYTASTNWKKPDFSRMIRTGKTTSWAELPVNPLSLSHFDSDLLSLRATDYTLASFASALIPAWNSSS